MYRRQHHGSPVDYDPPPSKGHPRLGLLFVFLQLCCSTRTACESNDLCRDPETTCSFCASARQLVAVHPRLQCLSEQTMQPTLVAALALGLTLGCCFLVSPASGFSFSRTLHDVEQDVAEDASLYSQEMRIGSGDLNGLPSVSQQQKQNHLEKYVTIKESPSSYVSVVRGHKLELKCEVDGSPPPRIYWVMGENPGRQVEQLERESVADVSYTAIARELSKLTIDCVGPQDQSLVHCVGVSGDKMVISQPTVLNVEGGNSTCDSAGSPPVITRHRPLYFSEIGSTVMLPCEAQGKPRPHVYWMDGEGNPLVDPRFVVQPNGNLLIANIRWQDMDGYKCLAKSILGEAEAVTFLYPAAKSESDKRKANAL